jgi:hypothetical protein
LLVVFGLSIIELWAAIPLGFAFNLHPATIFGLSSAGSIISALLVVLVGSKIRSTILRWRYGENKAPQHGRLHNIWERYGVMGLGLLSPLLLGAPLGAALGCVFGAEKWRLLLWMSLGIVLWSVALTVIGVLGLSGIGYLTN